MRSSQLSQQRQLVLRRSRHSLKAFPAHLQTWSVQINEGIASLDEASKEFIKTLQPSKSAHTNPLRVPKVQKTPKIASTAAHPQTPSQSAYLQYPMLPYPYYPSYDLLTPHMHPQHMSVPFNSTATATATAPLELHSSSLPSEVDNVERMVEYLEWLGKKTPRQSTMFAEALETLITAGHTFETVGLLGDEKFDKLGIVEGMGIQIRTQVARFKRAKAAGRI